MYLELYGFTAPKKQGSGTQQNCEEQKKIQKIANTTLITTSQERPRKQAKFVLIRNSRIQPFRSDEHGTVHYSKFRERNYEAPKGEYETNGIDLACTLRYLRSHNVQSSEESRSPYKLLSRAVQPDQKFKTRNSRSKTSYIARRILKVSRFYQTDLEILKRLGYEKAPQH